MAEVHVKEIPPAKPELTITMELSLNEAVAIAKICGRTGGAGTLRNAMSNIYRELICHKRIADICDDPDFTVGVFNVDGVNIPNER